MQRNINKTIIVNKVIKSEENLTIERIGQIIENKTQSTIQVFVELISDKNEVLTTQSYTIIGDNYTLLMSANPTFAPSKPENEYRETDLWYIIDLIRQENTAQ